MTGSHLPRARPFHRSPDPALGPPPGAVAPRRRGAVGGTVTARTGRGYSAPAFSASFIGICATLLADIHLVAW